MYKARRSKGPKRGMSCQLMRPLQKLCDETCFRHKMMRSVRAEGKVIVYTISSLSVIKPLCNSICFKLDVQNSYV
jgi:hypothetical protein